MLDGKPGATDAPMFDPKAFRLTEKEAKLTALALRRDVRARTVTRLHMDWCRAGAARCPANTERCYLSADRSRCRARTECLIGPAGVQRCATIAVLSRSA